MIVRLTLELWKDDGECGIYLSDDIGGSGIEVVGNNPDAAAHNIADYIADYFYDNDEH